MYISVLHIHKREILNYFSEEEKEEDYLVFFFSSSDKQFNICLYVYAKLKYAVSSGGGHEETR